MSAATRFGAAVGTLLVASAVLVAVAAPAHASTPILGTPRASVGQAQAWAKSKGAAPIFVDLANKYWEIASTRGGVRPEVAYAQAAHETGYMKYGGVVESTFKNPCGMKKPSGGPDNDPNAHQRYGSWEEGITACIDHLALYAGADGYPLPPGRTPDLKQYKSLFGTAKTVEELGGRWAPSPGYGSRIVENLLNPLLSTPEPKQTSPPSPPSLPAGSPAYEESTPPSAPPEHVHALFRIALAATLGDGISGEGAGVIAQRYVEASIR